MICGRLKARLNDTPSPGVWRGIADPAEQREVVRREERLAFDRAFVDVDHGIHFKSVRAFQVSQPVGECRGQ